MTKRKHGVWTPVTAAAGLLTAAAPGVAQPVWQEENGILAIEAEAAEGIPSAWRVETSEPGASGGAYLRALADSFNTPGVGTIGYDFRTETQADFQFAFRSLIGEGDSNTDSNDTWVRLVAADGDPLAPLENNNDTREAGWHKVFQNVGGEWTHQARNRDNVNRSLSWSLEADTAYTLELSSRSQGHLVDRLFLWDRGQYDLADEEQGNVSAAQNLAFEALPNSALVPEPAVASLALLALCGLRRRRR